MIDQHRCRIFGLFAGMRARGKTHRLTFDPVEVRGDFFFLLSFHQHLNDEGNITVVLISRLWDARHADRIPDVVKDLSDALGDGIVAGSLR